ncbi:DNA recombination protein RmuC [Prolixibacteraceae bacterium JC049]|nr:DNA recombination protein RmuC [Prolixibacteraceae bacterium JC049]
MDVISIIIGASMASLGTILVYKSITAKQQKVKEQQLSDLQQQQAILKRELELKQSGLSAKEEALAKVSEEKLILTNEITRLETEQKGWQEKLHQQEKELKRLQEQLTTQFENIAQRILKENSQELSATNQQKLKEVLSPLKEKITTFEKRVEETYEKSLKDQTDLKAELKKLGDMNLQIGQEARNLTRALKGDVKKQGNWGEMILERILEQSGLTEGREFKREQVDSNSAGSNIRPDVVIHLPDNKHIIIDSKVSLVAYERWVAAESVEEKQQAIKEHLLSMRTHIKELGKKHYQTAGKLNTPDFVLLFIPIESSFGAAIEADKDLFSFAWEQKVVLVSPSTLLATLRTIASIWQQENQTKNAIEIARQGGALYDKFVLFVKDLEKIGSNIDTLRKSYDSAFNKLSIGTGNLMRRSEKLRELGAKVSKELPQQYTDN